MSAANVAAIKEIPNNNVAKYELLALVSCTSSVDMIPTSLQPLTLADDALTNDVKLEAAFLGYMNNWLTEDPGMMDARKRPDDYLRIIRPRMRSTEPSVQIGACRCHYTISRCLTYRNIRGTSALAFLLDIEGELEKKLSEDARHFTVCLNLICGAIGRLLLTVRPRDATFYN